MSDTLERQAEQGRLQTQAESAQAALDDAGMGFSHSLRRSFDCAASQHGYSTADQLFARFAREVTQTFADQHEPRLEAVLAHVAVYHAARRRRCRSMRVAYGSRS